MSNEADKMTVEGSGSNVSGGSKKKRNRNKKKSKNKDNKDNNNAAASSSNNNNNNKRRNAEPQPQNNSMNPHAALRNDIHSQGYSFEEIDKAMEEMWDKGLAYDEADAVLKYLKSGGGGGGGSNNDNEEDSAGDNDDDTKTAEDMDEIGTKATDDSTYDEAVEGNDEDNEEGGSSKAVKPPPMTMIEKLDMVADFENMTDAVFALTEWVNKAAKPKDIGELCSAQNTKALPKIFCRSITECEENNRFEQSVFPAMERLMIALLGKCGVAAASFADTRLCFKSLMQQARKIYLMDQPGSEEYANRVSLFIVSRIAMALEECKVVTMTTQPAAGSVSAISITGNGAKSSSLSGTGVGNDVIANLLSTRELHKTAAKRFSVQARSACAKLTTMNGGGASSSSKLTEINGHAGETSSSNALEKDDMFLAIGGADVKHMFDHEKAKLEDLKVKMSEMESPKATELQTKIDEVQSERKLVAERIAELKISIENLESHDSQLCKKVVQLETDLETERSNQDAETNNLKVEIQHSQTAIKYGTSIGTLVDLLQKYDDALDAAVSGSIFQQQHSSSGTDNMGEVASESMEMLASRSAKYFSAEAQCVEFLRKRIDDNAKEIPALKKEILELEGLGMTTTISQMEETVRDKEELLIADAALVGRHTDEATAMYGTLIGQLEQYAALMSENGSGVVPAARLDALESIPSSASRLGIREPDRVTAYLKAANNGPPINTDPPKSNAVANNGVGVASNAPIGPAITMTEQSTTMPKFTWAAPSNKTGGSSVSKTSLVDIQQQELESKNL